jgi:plasmid stabilization system protein ParE
VTEIIFHDEALEELDEAHLWYWQRDERAADRFLSEVQIAVERIAGDPRSLPRYDDEHQFLQLRTFPYLVVFRPKGDHAEVLAVAHVRRRPGYWRSR